MEKVERSIFKIIKKIRREFNGSHSLKVYWNSKYCELFLIDNKKQSTISQAIIRNDGMFASNKYCSQYIVNIIEKYFNYKNELDYNEI